MAGCGVWLIPNATPTVSPIISERMWPSTSILVITFAVEIGQRLTNTGNMEFADIVFGIGGFIVMFAVYAVYRAIRLRNRAGNGSENETPKA